MLYITGFALALAVLACAGTVSLTLRVLALTRAWGSISLKVDILYQLKDKATPAIVTAALDDMRAALAMMAQSNARQFGSINARMRKQPEGGPAANDPDFDQQRKLDAMLGLPSLTIE
jgi:hypothetical protein